MTYGSRQRQDGCPIGLFFVLASIFVASNGCAFSIPCEFRSGFWRSPTRSFVFDCQVRLLESDDDSTDGVARELISYEFGQINEDRPVVVREDRPDVQISRAVVSHNESITELIGAIEYLVSFQSRLDIDVETSSVFPEFGADSGTIVFLIDQSYTFQVRANGITADVSRRIDITAQASDFSTPAGDNLIPLFAPDLQEGTTVFQVRR